MHGVLRAVALQHIHVRQMHLRGAIGDALLRNRLLVDSAGTGAGVGDGGNGDICRTGGLTTTAAQPFSEGASLRVGPAAIHKYVDARVLLMSALSSLPLSKHTVIGAETLQGTADTNTTTMTQDSEPALLVVPGAYGLHARCQLARLVANQNALHNVAGTVPSCVALALQFFASKDGLAVCRARYGVARVLVVECDELSTCASVVQLEAVPSLEDGRLSPATVFSESSTVRVLSSVGTMGSGLYDADCLYVQDMLEDEGEADSVADGGGADLQSLVDLVTDVRLGSGAGAGAGSERERELQGPPVTSFYGRMRRTWRSTDGDDKEGSVSGLGDVLLSCIKGALEKSREVEGDPSFNMEAFRSEEDAASGGGGGGGGARTPPDGTEFLDGVALWTGEVQGGNDFARSIRALVEESFDVCVAQTRVGGGGGGKANRGNNSSNQKKRREADKDKDKERTGEEHPAVVWAHQSGEALWNGACLAAESRIRVLDAPLRGQNLGVAIVRSGGAAPTQLQLDRLVERLRTSASPSLGSATGTAAGLTADATYMVPLSHVGEPSIDGGVSLRPTPAAQTVQVAVVGGTVLGTCIVIDIDATSDTMVGSGSAGDGGGDGSGGKNSITNKSPSRPVLRTPSKRQRNAQLQQHEAQVPVEAGDMAHWWVLVLESHSPSDGPWGVDVVCSLGLAWGAGAPTGSGAGPSSSSTAVLHLDQRAGLFHAQLSQPKAAGASPTAQQLLGTASSDLLPAVTNAVLNLSPFRSPARGASASEPLLTGNISKSGRDAGGRIAGEDPQGVSWGLRLLSMVVAVMLSLCSVLAARHVMAPATPAAPAGVGVGVGMFGLGFGSDHAAAPLPVPPGSAHVPVTDADAAAAAATAATAAAAIDAAPKQSKASRLLNFGRKDRFYSTR